MVCIHKKAINIDLQDQNQHWWHDETNIYILLRTSENTNYESLNYQITKCVNFSLSDQTLNQNHKARKQLWPYHNLVNWQNIDNKGMQNTDDDVGNKRTLSLFTVFHGLFSLSVHRYLRENHVSVSGDFSVEVGLSLVLKLWRLLVAVKTVWQCHGQGAVLLWRIRRGKVALIYRGTNQYFILWNSEINNTTTCRNNCSKNLKI